jgi:hypothetical protein
VQESETLEARRAEVDSGRQIKGETRVKRSCTSGGRTSGGSKCGEFETPESLKSRRPSWSLICGRYVSTDRGLWVKALQEKRA